MWVCGLAISVVATTAPVVLAALAAPAYAVPTLTVGGNVNASRTSGNQSEAGVAADPQNPQRLFMAMNSDAGSFGLLAETSSDGGATWTRRMIADGSDSLALGCCDATAAWDAFGNLFLSYFGATLNSAVVALSNDGGATFTQLTEVQSFDQPSVTTGPNSVWVTFTNGVQMTAMGAQVTGRGAVGPFSPPEAAPGSDGGNFGGIAVGPAGQVLITYQVPSLGEGPAIILVNLDADGLGSGGFGPAVPVTTTNVGGFDFIPAQPDRSIDAEANLAWDRSGHAHNGRVYLSYTDERPDESNNTDIYVRYSDDSGRTWSASTKVNDDLTARSQFLPAISLDPTSGNVAVTFYDARNDTGSGAGSTDRVPNDDAQYWGSVSLDGGATFLPNVQISAGTSHENDLPGPGSADLDFGDYTASVFLDGNLYAAWADNSNSTGDNPDGRLAETDVYVARIRLAASRSSDLAVTKSAPGTTAAAEQLVYSLTVRNAGPDPATAVTAVDTLPAGVRFQSSSARCTAAGQVVTCNVGDLPNQTTTAFTITTSVAGTVAVGAVLENRVTVSSASTDPASGNNTATAETTVTKNRTVTRLESSPNPSDFGRAVTFTATVQVPGGAGVPSGSVAFVLDGVRVAVEPVAGGGRSVFTTTGIQPGQHSVTAAYSGDDRFLPSGGAVSQSVTCAQNLTGTIVGRVTADAGSWCVRQATIAGTLTVMPGARVSVVGSSVAAGVSSDGAAAFSLCSSRLSGTGLDVRNSSGFVLVGDPGDDRCGANTIEGPAVLRSNSGGAEVVSNRLGSLTVDGTTGVGPFANDAAPEIGANSISGDLSCQGNAPPPVNGGQPNFVGGMRSGQCSAAAF
jgi:uncharacterized repeat protein (TIGR01451 family)